MSLIIDSVSVMTRFAVSWKILRRMWALSAEKKEKVVRSTSRIFHQFRGMSRDRKCGGNIDPNYMSRAASSRRYVVLIEKAQRRSFRSFQCLTMEIYRSILFPEKEKFPFAGIYEQFSFAEASSPGFQQINEL